MVAEFRQALATRFKTTGEVHRSHNIELPKTHSETICTFDYDHTSYPITPGAQSNCTWLKMFTSALKSRGAFWAVTNEVHFSHTAQVMPAKPAHDPRSF